MKRENIISIYNNIPKVVLARPLNDPLEYYRFRSCNAYIASELITVRDDETEKDHEIRLIKSYNTIVAFYDYDTNTFCEIGKFSRTTSKQLTQIHSQEFRSSKRVNAMHILW